MVVLVTEEIQKAVERLSLPKDTFHRLEDEQAEKLYFELLGKFVDGADRRWWWEAFRSQSESVKFDDGKAFERVREVVPDEDECVWFIAEEDQLPFYPIYESTPKNIQKVIGECYGFEYYIIPKTKNWLLCENHHDYLIGVGNEVIDRLRTCRA